MSLSKTMRAEGEDRPMTRIVSRVNPGTTVIKLKVDPLTIILDVPTEMTDREVFFSILNSLVSAYEDHHGGRLLRDYSALVDR